MEAAPRNLIQQIADMRPGTMLFNTFSDYYFVKMARHDGWGIGGTMLFNVKTGTMHHASEYFNVQDVEFAEDWLIQEIDDDR